MVFVGMDLHRCRTQVAVLDDDGDVVMNRNMVNGSAEFTELVAGLPSRTPVAVEAGYGWQWLADLLEGADLEMHLVHPAGCKAIAAARLKDDRVDARTLAHLLCSDLLPEAWVAPGEVRDLRRLLRHRAALVRMRSSLKNRIHGILADHGVRVERNLWTGPGRQWLAAVELPVVSRQVIENSLQLIGHTDALVTELRRGLAETAEGDPRVEALCQLPGIGPLTALTLLAEIGDISRFGSSRKLCAWAGLTPQVRNSDRRVRHGHITKQGSPWVRWVMVEAAHVAKHRPPFAEFYASCARRRGRNIATVAVARKLLARCFHILTEIHRDGPDAG